MERRLMRREHPGIGRGARGLVEELCIGGSVHSILSLSMVV